MELTNLEIAIRLVLALILGGLIGLERESHGRPAGFRTHILVCVGSALVMLVSAYAFMGMETGREGGYDPGRIAAQVISGIGFLGAGTIMREGANIRGLTTAASLWSVAGIGLTIGAGFYFPALLATALVVLTLIFLNRVEWAYLSHKQEVLRVQAQDTPGQLAKVFTAMAEHDVNVVNVSLYTEAEGEVAVELAVEVPPKANRIQILDELVSTPGINRASFK